MLTTDLLRARTYKGEVRPRYLNPDDPENLALATGLVTVFASHVGASREALDNALTTLLGEGTDVLLHRGLAKLLSDRAEFTMESPCDPTTLRRRLFEESAKNHPAVRTADAVHTVTRDDVIARVAAELGISAEAAQQAMYADLNDALRMVRGPDVSPQALLHRYNLALAQAVLLRAVSLTVEIPPGDPGRYRQLFRYVKFFRLMHRVTGRSDEGYRVVLDGPASIFHQSQKYGLQLAEFLPALALCPAWSAQAELSWGTDRRPMSFKLTSSQGLVSHYPDTGVYVTREEQWLMDRWAAMDTPWVLERRAELIDLGGRGVLIPDFVVRHPEDGRFARVEILGFWRREYLHARWKLLQEHGPANLVVAVPWRLRGSEDEIGDLPGAVMPFKDVILAKELLSRVERIAHTESHAVVSPGTTPSARRRRPGAKVAPGESP